MAAPTKSGSAVISSQSSAAGSTYASPSSGCQSASQDVSTAFGALWTIRMTPAGTLGGGCTVQVDVSYNGTAWRKLHSLQSGLVSGTDYDACIEVPDDALYTRITFFGNLTAATTCSAELSKTTAIS